MISTEIRANTVSYKTLLDTFVTEMGWDYQSTIVRKAVTQNFKRITGLSLNSTVTPELFNGNIRLLMRNKDTAKFATYLTFYDFR